MHSIEIEAKPFAGVVDIDLMKITFSLHLINLRTFNILILVSLVLRIEKVSSTDLCIINAMC